MVADRRLYLTADKTELVEEGNPRGAFLYCSPGQFVDEQEVERLLRRKNGEPEAKALEAPPENKAVLAPPAVKRKPGRPVGWRKPKPNE